ncbi:wd40 repeat family [Anaeramoeba flamelloides]|uniref:Wd40 repeat family n=1 Tax=Anaeramoeba flamelloides TaxID=1746091 RepID=A0ABQ8Z355_9EUKA|nr:wd40 repeat family [Anaeramoeba flamelloides]
MSKFVYDQDLNSFRESYRVWLSNRNYFYQYVISKQIGRSLSIQFTNYIKKENGSQEFRLIVGEDRNEEGKFLVHYSFDYSESSYIETKEDEGKKFKVIEELRFGEEIQRARHRPSDSNKIAAMDGDGLIHLFNLGGNNTQKQILKGHTKEGYGISWNSRQDNLLVSCAYDNNICIWDTNQTDSQISPLYTFKDRLDSLEDIQWNPFDKNVFGCVGDDKKLGLYDIRQKKCTSCITAHSNEVNCLSFQPHYENYLLTSSSDQQIALWDIRKMGERMHTFLGHSGQIYRIDWSPLLKDVFASADDKNKIILWDTSKIGDEQIGRDADIGPPELIFKHVGNRDEIRDFCWSPYIKWMIAAVDDNFCLQVWKIDPDTILENMDDLFISVFDELKK